MHERHIDEATLNREEFVVKADLNEMGCYLTCERISRKRTWVIAEHVTRKLITEQDEGKARMRGVLPVHEGAFCSSMVIIKKTLTDSVVKLRIRGKPELMPGIVVGLIITRGPEPE